MTPAAQLWICCGSLLAAEKRKLTLRLLPLFAIYRRIAPKFTRRRQRVAAIMRYTLRLLTAQQFIRAAAVFLPVKQLGGGLINSPDKKSDLGQVPFSIGLWVGKRRLS